LVSPGVVVAWDAINVACKPLSWTKAGSPIGSGRGQVKRGGAYSMVLVHPNILNYWTPGGLRGGGPDLNC